MNKIIILILLLATFHAFGQSIALEKTNDIFIHLYNQNASKFDSITTIEKGNNYINLVKAYNYYWNGLSASNIYPSFNYSEQIINESLLTEKNANIRATFYLLQMRMDITQKKYLTVWLNTGKIKSYFTENLSDKNNTYNQLLWGLYNYFVDYSRQSSFIYASFLVGWPASDKNLGISTLKKLTLNNSAFISTEATYFLGKIYLELENNPELASKYFLVLKNKYPGNKIYCELFENCKKQLTRL